MVQTWRRIVESVPYGTSCTCGYISILIYVFFNMYIVMDVPDALVSYGDLCLAGKLRSKWRLCFRPGLEGPRRPNRRPTWLEFDVQSVERATAALESQGYRILIKNKKEPWGQTVSRLLSPEGLLVGITFTPLMRKEK